MSKKSWYQPETITCCECGVSFTLDAREVEWFHTMGLELPRRCELCRRGKHTRNENREPRRVTR